jgi:anti-sigma factor RsiW
MKHPQRDEWVPFVFGEAASETRQRLAAHLEHCPECAGEVAAWRRSLGRLDHWQPSGPVPRPGNVFRPLRWAIAAALVLGAGFGLGRFSRPPPPDGAEWRAQVVASMKAALVPELREQMVAEVERVASGAQAQSSNALVALEARLAQASQSGLQQAILALTGALNDAREEDRHLLTTVLDQLQEQRATDYVALRKDLETLATLTDDEIRQARLKLNQLVARAQIDNEN